SIFNYLENPSLTPILQSLIVESSLPLKSVEVDFAADSTGFSAGRFERWFSHKHGGEKFRQEWVKVHVMCGVKTNIVTAVEIRGKFTHDAPMLVPMLETTARNFQMRDVLCDKGYHSVQNAKEIARLNAVPFIPFKSGAVGGSKSAAVAMAYREMYHYF